MYDDITVVGGPPKPVPVAEVDAAEAALGVRFPVVYREYVTRFGGGVLGGTYVRIHPPGRLLAGDTSVAEWRRRIGEYWFWDDGGGVLTKAQALESVAIGDTVEGDELVVHPSDPDRVYVLPRHSDEIHIAGDGLPAAIEWLCSSGTLTEPFAERDFEPDAG